MQLFYGVPEDIEKWMSLVTQVRWNFPGLETQEKLNEHRATVLKSWAKTGYLCKGRKRDCRCYAVLTRT